MKTFLSLRMHRSYRLQACFFVILTFLFFFSFPVHSFAAEPNNEEAAGIQAFLDFFGPDGVNECLEQGPLLSADPSMMTSDQQAVLTTVWETVGGGRINRKYLNGLVAFCYDEELAFPNGAIYQHAIASDAAVHGQVAAIAQRFGRSGVDNAQWWSECQVAIWAVRAGCQSYDSAAAFARSYCADRGIIDSATVKDYACIVGTLVTETAGANDTAYLYHADDPSNQRILTYLSVWPDPAPAYPSPQYDQISATEEYQAIRSHQILLDRKTAAITGEPLAGAVFAVYEEERLVGTITTNAQGQGFCQWELEKTATATIAKEYCSNYDKLDPETRKTITGYTNREDAYAAAKEQALAAAKEQAEALANQITSVTITETTVPTGFSATSHSTQTVPLTDQETSGLSSVTISAVNAPWSATLLIEKADSITGQIISKDTVFTLYEWNGSEYQISPHYEIVRGDDGIYTVTSSYPQGQPGQLYYTQTNQGMFALAESQAPEGYLLEEAWFYFQITEDGQTIRGHNDPSHSDAAGENAKFYNTAVTGTIRISKTGDYLTSLDLTEADPNKKDPEETDSTDPNNDPLLFRYTSYPVADASFAIYAAQDILQPDGSGQVAIYNGIPLYKDTLVATVTTNHNGIAILEGLPLGIYEVHEVNAGQGDFLLSPQVVTVTLSYRDQYTDVVTDDSARYHNQRQQISLQLTKLNPEQQPLSGAVFGLYNTEPIYGHLPDETGSLIPTSEPLIPADTLLEIVTTNAQGQACFQTDLPCGNYYIQELAPPAGYLLNHEIYTVDANYTGQTGEAILFFSHTFYNEPVPPQEPEPPAPNDVPFSSGAPTGDNNPLALICWNLLGSLVVMIPVRKRFFQ